MIVVDTNVISELARPEPDHQVVEWFGQRDDAELYLASPVLAELLTGALLLPEGRRRRDLESAIGAVIEAFFGDRQLPFDADAAWSFASVSAAARRAGRTIAPKDAAIAAIARAWGASVATRDTSPFAMADVPTINPWTS